MTTPELQSRADGPAWRITIDRAARRNALTPALAGAMAAEITRVTTEGTACAVLLEGAGGHFSAGLDLRWLASLGAAPALADIRAGLAQFQAAILAIVRAPDPGRRPRAGLGGRLRRGPRGRLRRAGRRHQRLVHLGVR